MLQFAVKHSQGVMYVYAINQMAVFNYVNTFYPNLWLISIKSVTKINQRNGGS